MYTTVKFSNKGTRAKRGMISGDQLEGRFPILDPKRNPMSVMPRLYEGTKQFLHGGSFCSFERWGADGIHQYRRHLHLQILCFALTKYT